MHKHAYLTIWLFFAGLGGAALFLLYSMDYWYSRAMMLDTTGISVFIAIVFFLGWIFAARDIFWLTGLQNPSEGKFERRETRASYIKDFLIALGFIGTLVGLLMITVALGDVVVKETDPTKINLHVREALKGMSTAFLTTIVGAIGSAFLELLHVVFRNGYVKLLENEEAPSETPQKT